MSANATNSLGIRYLTSGPVGIRTKFNELIRALDYLYPRPSPDILPRVSPQGTTYALRSPSALNSARGAQSFTLYTQALTVAGIIPTNTEIATAMVAAYTTASLAPRQGDMVNLTVGGVCKLRAVVTTTGTASGLYVVAFTVSSTTYYAQVVQTGLY